MRRGELLLEHKFGHRNLRALRIKPGRDPLVLGSSRSADLRLAGSEVSPIHAAIEYRDNHWILMDIGSTSGTWVGDKSVNEHPIDRPTTIYIGKHKLMITPKVVRRELFVHQPQFDKSLESHQIIVRNKAGMVIRTHLQEAKEPYKYWDGAVEKTLPPPKDHQWHETRSGNIIIHQRLIPKPDKALTAALAPDEFNAKTTSLIAGAIIAIFALTYWLFPKVPDSQLNLNDLSKEKYAQMIFNASIVKKKREESKVATQVQVKRSQPAAAAPSQKTPEKNPVANVSPTAQKAITNIRAAGLGQLIGKIAKRMSPNAIHLTAVGVDPDRTDTGAVSFSKNKNLAAQGLAGMAKGDNNFKLSGVSTAGKAGGSGDYKSAGRLQGGNVGKGDVGVVEEETLVDGGLDREAIAEVIRRDIGQIRYCYERQLSAQPDLYGKILVKFTIGADGLVSSPMVGNSTLNNAMVEGCILRRVAKWKFPNPKGGTSVFVSYPFLLKSSN